MKATAKDRGNKAGGGLGSGTGGWTSNQRGGSIKAMKRVEVLQKVRGKGVRGSPMYDWGRWFALGRFTLVKGVHYVTGLLSIAQQIRQAACNRGYYVRLRDAVTADGKQCIQVVVTGRRDKKGA